MEKPPDAVSHEFEVDADDHCETSPEAHAHIVNFLNKAAQACGKTPKTLVIYDPYFCAGGTKRSFAALGFPNVVNENKDFYSVLERGEVPQHDVLVTNPPYSADHVERCITFAARNLYQHDRPYFLLLPSYCVNKPYYMSALLTGGAEGKALKEALKEEKTHGGTVEKPPDAVSHEFEVDADDHCETSPEAHAHIVNFLNKAAQACGKTPKTLVIYDPYFCAGGTKRSFAALGFPNVVNENKDFYSVLERGEVPQHDVLVTNPPYSADHVERCITFAARNLYQHDRPYFLLLPSYCVNKPYYMSALLTGGAEGKALKEALKEEKTHGGTEENGDTGSAEPEHESGSESGENPEFKVHDGGEGRVKHKKIATRNGSARRQTLPFYVAPVKRYYYWTPKPLIAARKAQQAGDVEGGKARRKKSHVGRLGERTSPFLSFWYCGMGDSLQPEALRWHRKLPRAAVDGYTVARNPNDLPMHVLDEWDPRRAAAVERAKEAGDDGAKPKRYAGFSGHNCGQNMDTRFKKKYKEFDNSGGGGTGKNNNWSKGKGGDGGMFKRPAKKRKY